MQLEHILAAPEKKRRCLTKQDFGKKLSDILDQVTLLIQICPKKGIIPIFLSWQWDVSTINPILGRVSGFLGYDILGQARHWIWANPPVIYLLKRCVFGPPKEPEPKRRCFGGPNTDPQKIFGRLGL